MPTSSRHGNVLNSMANENYAKQFLKAVIVYNSDHIK